MERHLLRDASTELYGGQLIKPFERQGRVDAILSAIRETDLGEICNPVVIDTNYLESE